MGFTAEAVLVTLQKLVDGPQVGRKHNLAAGFTVSTNLMHGTSGIFGTPGIEQDIFATRVKPTGLLAILPAVPTIIEQPLVGYLTGFTASAGGAEKDAVCDTPLASGQMKSCLQGALFGRYERKTEVIELNSALRQNNRGEFLDLRLVNDPTLDSGLSVPSSINGQAADAINRLVLSKWLALGVAFERKLGPQVFTGNPNNNSTNGGYKEFHGLETLVGTGKIDVITSTLCKALDSDLRNYTFKRADQNGADLVTMLTSMVRNTRDIAQRTGLDPAEWVFVMRRNLFDTLADIWPCAYGTYKCAAGNVN